MHLYCLSSSFYEHDIRTQRCYSSGTIQYSDSTCSLEPTLCLCSLSALHTAAPDLPTQHRVIIDQSNVGRTLRRTGNCGKTSGACTNHEDFELQMVHVVTTLMPSSQSV